MNDWTDALAAYLEHPSPQDGGICEEDMEMVDSIVREALRLYPPTRHIHRHYTFTNGSSLLAIADIEGLHRDTEVWGPDADAFEPGRWVGMTRDCEQKKAWMPFGGSPFVCPAKSDFGPRMIGILVASLVEAFSDDKYELRREGPRGRMDLAVFEGPLLSERNAYEELYLEQNACCGC